MTAQTETYLELEWNVGSRPDALLRSALFDILTQHKPHVVKLCEIGDRHEVVAKVARACGYEFITGDADGQGKLGLLIRRDLFLLDHGFRPASPRRDVGEWGAGPRVIDAKWILWARIEFAGRKIDTAVTHAVPSVQRPADTKAAKAGRRKRRQLYTLHLLAIAAWFMLRPFRIRILAGDLNATPEFPPLQRLRAMLALCLATVPSHGDRAIDQFLFVGGRRIQVTRCVGLDGFPSDHRPVLATFNIRVRRGTAA